VTSDADPDNRERPDFIEIGLRDDGVTLLALSELAGVTITGPMAASVLRAWVAALLTRAGPIAAELLATEGTLTRVDLGGDVAGDHCQAPGMRVVADLGVIRRELEGEVDHRTSQFELDGVDDIATYRRTYPWDPMPAVLALIDSVSADDEIAWRDLMERGARVGVGALFLDGSTAAETHIVVDEASVITSVQPETRAPALVGVRCFTLGVEEADDVIEVLVEADERPTSDDVEPSDSFELIGAEVVVPDAVGVEQWPEIDDELATDNTAAEEGPSKLAPPIVVHLFGSCEIAVNGTVIEKGVRSVAKELLAWLALRPDGASIGAIVEGCWPDTERRLVNDTFWRAASDLRTKVGAIAEPRSRLVDQVGEVYRLDHASLECDLWQFQAALGVAANSDDAGVARAALRSATSLFRGEFVENADYRWVEPVREDLHRRALDAHLRLAELEEELGSLDAAESALDAAIELDRYAEEPYRRLMTLQARRERIDAVAATWRRLERHLAEIDVDPEQATSRLYRTLTSGPATSRLRLSS
jgi:DNA-binding SARP family transcriptional activator